MEVLLFIAIIIGINELKEWRLMKKYDSMKDDIEILKNKFTIVVEKSSEMIDLLNSQSGLIREAIESSETKNAFIDKAKSDLETIVNEYKINGIPLNYQRKRVEAEYDAVEGI